jgi:hypothetical protein
MDIGLLISTWFAVNGIESLKSCRIQLTIKATAFDA